MVPLVLGKAALPSNAGNADKCGGTLVAPTGESFARLTCSSPVDPVGLYSAKTLYGCATANGTWTEKTPCAPSAG